MTDDSDIAGVGRFDVHSHLLPGVDDGCTSLDETLQCAREMVLNGYTHSFCTPHFWPSYPRTTVVSVPSWTQHIQNELDRAHIPLKLFPGGEINLRDGLTKLSISELPTFNMAGKYALIDLWAERLPAFFEPTVKWMQAGGLTVILAHPERMRAVQEQPELADYFAEQGILLQGNLQCLSDNRSADTRITVERYLSEDRYFLLGSDLHNIATLPNRIKGLGRAIELVGEEKVKVLTADHPRLLLSDG